MSDAKRDQNRVAALLVKSSASDTLIELLADSITQRLLVNATITGNIQVAGLVPESYDYVVATYTGTNMTTAIFKTGGSGGTVVATLTMTYDGSNNMLTATRT